MIVGVCGLWFDHISYKLGGGVLCWMDVLVLGRIKETILGVAVEYGVVVDDIILFGSRARGDFREDSDWDVLVVTRDRVEEDVRWMFVREVTRRLARDRIDVQIVVVDRLYFDKYSGVYGDIAGIASLEGFSI